MSKPLRSPTASVSRIHPRRERGAGLSVEAFLQQNPKHGSRLAPWLDQINALIKAEGTLDQIRRYLAANGVTIGTTGISNFLARNGIKLARARTPTPAPPSIDTCNCEHSDTEICRINRWEPGTVLTGSVGAGETVIQITAIGEASILAKELRRDGKASSEVAGRETVWKLSGRDWHAIS